MFPNQDETLSDDLSNENDDSISTDTLSMKSKQDRINVASGKYLIIKCNLPLNLVENQGFRDFMKECNLKWDPISTKPLKQNVIRTFSSKVDAIIHQTLNGVNHVTLTVDGWSDRRCRSFLGVTCHFIDNKMQPQSHLIDFVRFQSHTRVKTFSS